MSEGPGPSGQPGGQGFMGNLKETMKKAGEAIDRGMAAVLKEAGQNIRATCPGCQKEVNAPPDELVECPLCKTHFRSPTVSARTAEISRTMKEDLKQAYKAERGPTPAEPSAGQREPFPSRVEGPAPYVGETSSGVAEHVPSRPIEGPMGGGIQAPTTSSVGVEQPSRATETQQIAGEKLTSQEAQVPPRGAGA